MGKQWKTFLTTVMYFTRIRVPASIGHDPAYLRHAPRYLPAIGWITGGVSALVYVVFAWWTTLETGILASMIAGLLVTGAFHEDGFADVCDGFGGGWTKEKILLIMKDSRIGAFGAIGLVMILAFKFYLIRDVFWWSPYKGLLCFVRSPHWVSGNVCAAMLAGHSLSRLMPVLVVRWSVNVTDPDHSKSKPVTGGSIGAAELIPATIFAFLPFILLPWPSLLVILPVLGATLWLNRWFKKWIGGYTGDCLGAIQQVAEIVTYLGIGIIWKSI